MRIGVIGSGKLGGTVGTQFALHGHDVVFGTRGGRDEEMKALVAKAGPRASSAPIAEAVSTSEVIFLATPWNATEAAVKGAGDLSGKILIDATNPLRADFSGLSLGTTTSAAETIAQWAPGARVVKAFNASGDNVFATPAFPEGKACVFYCGDDADAKQVVAGLISDLGLEPIDTGGLAEARLLEPLAMLWITMAIKRGLGREIGWRLMRR